jgi:glycosyltransferase involved in cell wall biosynthesis
MLRALAETHDIELVTAFAGTAAPDAMGDACVAVTNFPPAPSRFVRLAQAIRPKSSLFTAGRASRALRAHVRKRLASGTIAQVHLGHLAMHDAVDRSSPVPIVFDAHNCETDLLAMRAGNETRPLRDLLAFDARRVRAIERAIVLRARRVTACSSDDIAALAAFVPEIAAKATVIPNGVDVERYASVREATPDARAVAITGSMDWRPNQLGLWWFVDRVLPLLRAAGVALPTIRVIGRMPAEIAARIASVPELTPVPNPPDMRAELARARIVVAPITVSSGTRLRILEAWAAGRPVVTTRAGALGLVAEDGRDYALADEPQAFAAAFLRALSDETMWATLRAGGLARARTYDWRAIGADVRAAHAL